MFSIRENIFSSKNAIIKTVLNKTSYLPQVGEMAIDTRFVFTGRKQKRNPQKNRTGSENCGEIPLSRKQLLIPRNIQQDQTNLILTTFRPSF
ncbi:hypothetical protein MSLAZ_3108 [Methanosarcina lacustris Z-7289]|uniref:Uncharacterized protein n=1 Tax=Methanosarcina lacustris Z-7289 TaxID=1434111 RepID=A0A0E3S5H3_9EURY|nr:hypothetical protein MSLAZ_3108 [Methanosarcina lacustris Z-7289]